MASLDGDTARDIQHSWIEEALRREAQLLAGTSGFVNGDDVVARLRAHSAADCDPAIDGAASA